MDRQEIDRLLSVAESNQLLRVRAIQVFYSIEVAALRHYYFSLLSIETVAPFNTLGLCQGLTDWLTMKYDLTQHFNQYFTNYTQHILEFPLFSLFDHSFGGFIQLLFTLGVSGQK